MLCATCFVCSYDCAVYSKWSAGVDEIANSGLNKCLLRKDPVIKHLAINFDPKV